MNEWNELKLPEPMVFLKDDIPERDLDLVAVSDTLNSTGSSTDEVHNQVRKLLEDAQTFVSDEQLEAAFQEANLGLFVFGELMVGSQAPERVQESPGSDILYMIREKPLPQFQSVKVLLVEKSAVGDLLTMQHKIIVVCSDQYVGYKNKDGTFRLEVSLTSLYARIIKITRDKGFKILGCIPTDKAPQIVHRLVKN